MNTPPLVALTMGDPAGVGPEILVRCLSELSGEDAWSPIVIGSTGILERACSVTGSSLGFTRISEPGEADVRSDRVQVLEPEPLDHDVIHFGELSAEAGRAAVGYIEEATRLCLDRRVSAMVTCPVNKEAIHLAGFTGDIGHQEILARMTGADLTATLLMTPGLKVAHLSTHKSLGQAVQYIRRSVIVDKLRLTARSLEQWGLVSPRIAVAAVNPHAGEGGLLGREEIEEIEPAVVEARAEGILAEGPFPADSVFYRAIDGEFDAVLAMYHDQGHIAIKVHNFEDSITATMGIPFVRTSVDHGTAFEIAGRNIASHRSLIMAIRTALAMVNGRLS